MYELIPLYHNLALRYGGLRPGIAPSQQYLSFREFLFASLAWSIFKRVQGFLDTERWDGYTLELSARPEKLNGKLRT